MNSTVKFIFYMVKMADWGDTLSKIAKKRTFKGVGFALELCCDCVFLKSSRKSVLEKLGFFTNRFLIFLFFLLIDKLILSNRYLPVFLKEELLELVMLRVKISP